MASLYQIDEFVSIDWTLINIQQSRISILITMEHTSNTSCVYIIRDNDRLIVCKYCIYIYIYEYKS